MTFAAAVDAYRIADGVMLTWDQNTGWIDVHVFEEGKMWIGYRTTTNNARGTTRGTTCWDVNVWGEDFYLIWIEVKAEDRGKGYGDQLYKLITEIARRMGCKRIIQNPSGKSPQGETRRDYLLRRGWVPHGEDELMKALQI